MRFFNFLVLLIAYSYAPLTYAESKELRALVVAQKEATLSAGITGRIDKLDYEIGDRVKKGQILVSIDARSYQAELDKTKAELNQAEKFLAAHRQLQKSNAVSAIEISKSEADVAKAKADYELKKYYLNECIIKAPYDLRITKKLANAHEISSQGTKLLSIVSDEKLRVQLLVPSNIYDLLKIKNKLNLVLDETKKTYSLSISHIGAKIDPASQSVEVYATFDEYDPNVIVGMSGSIDISSLNSSTGAESIPQP